MKTKICGKCNEEKHFDRFSKDKGGKYGLCSHCKKCVAEYQKHRRKVKREQISKQRKIYREENKDKIKERGRIYYEENKDQILLYMKEYRDNSNKEEIAEYQKAYREDNKEEIRTCKRYWRKRKMLDPIYSLKHNLRTRIQIAIREGYGEKAYKTIELLGCSWEEVREHIESQFTEGMSWNNYGLHGWHIDHILPCASFDLSDLEQQKKCFHYTNLQPLWAEDNLRKSDKIIDKFGSGI